MRKLHNLRHNEDAGFSEGEMEVLRTGLGIEPTTLKNDKRDLVGWWEAGLVQKIAKIFGVTLKEELINQDILGDLRRNEYVDLDFLGYGVCAPSQVESIVNRRLVWPTLTRKRLSKALAFSKAEYGLRDEKYRR